MLLNSCLDVILHIYLWPIDFYLDDVLRFGSIKHICISLRRLLPEFKFNVRSKLLKLCKNESIGLTLAFINQHLRNPMTKM